MLPWAGRFECISCLGSWDFKGLAGLSISVYCVRLGVLWRFSRLVVVGVSNVWVAYMYIFLDQGFTNHVHVAS